MLVDVTGVDDGRKRCEFIHRVVKEDRVGHASIQERPKVVKHELDELSLTGWGCWERRVGGCRGLKGQKFEIRDLLVRYALLDEGTEEQMLTVRREDERRMKFIAVEKELSSVGRG